MNHDPLAEHLSPHARDILTQLFHAVDSQAFAVADCLNTIANNDQESATDEFLSICAQEIRNAADDVITALHHPTTSNSQT